MNSEVVATLNLALQYLRTGNYRTAKNALKLINKKFPNNVEVLKLLSTTLALDGECIEALNLINRAIKYAPSYGALYLSKGNILSELNNLDESLASYQTALQFDPMNWEIHNNKGNVLQKLGKYQEAILAYEVALNCDGCDYSVFSNTGNVLQKLKEFTLAIQAYDAALGLNPNDFEVLSNKGNALVALENFDEAKLAYTKAISLFNDYSDAHLNLANLYLSLFNFKSGWEEYEWRFGASEASKLILDEITIPRWSGSFVNSLLVIGEQGIGDQILYSLIFQDLRIHAKNIAIIVDSKLVNTLSRAYPDYQFYDKDSVFDVSRFDAYIPIGSLGKYFRSDIDAFPNQPSYNLGGVKKSEQILEARALSGKKIIGVSWRSSNKKIGSDKSIALRELLPLFEIDNAVFFNLQYGETELERENLKNFHSISLETINNLNLFDDIDGLLGAIESCDVVVTTSNTTAHLAGACGKETLLLLPKAVGKFWYWQDINNISLWYPSIKVFRQNKQGDWSDPVNKAREYLERRFAN